MDVDHPRARAKELVKIGLELGIPIQNVDVDAVNSIETDIAMGIAIREPLRTRAVIGTVDDVGNVLLCHEPLR